jgi:short-subunit dehydrogenase involved in D-alanine esterification of teichoic acids
METQGNTILITGGGSGIGGALAHRLHDAGNTVVIVGRRSEVLENAIEGRPNMHSIVGDVDTPAGVEALVNQARAEHPAVNVLVNNGTKAAIHSYTVSLREALRGRVEVIELAPPAVQTDLTPGQKTREGYLPLDAFADEVVTLLSEQPTPPDVLVDRVHFLRFAEAENRFDDTLAKLNEQDH